MKKVLISIARLYPEAKYRLQYHDYPPEQWTVQGQLTIERIEHFCPDNSVSKVEVELPDLTLIVFS